MGCTLYGYTNVVLDPQQEPPRSRGRKRTSNFDDLVCLPDFNNELGEEREAEGRKSSG